MYDNEKDWLDDPGFYNGDAHYRLYLNKLGAYSVICVQDSDYMDYDARMILYPESWDLESDAEKFLFKVLPIMDKVRVDLSNNVTTELRYRLLARGIRERLQSIQVRRILGLIEEN